MIYLRESSLKVRAAFLQQAEQAMRRRSAPLASTRSVLMLALSSCNETAVQRQQTPCSASSAAEHRAALRPPAEAPARRLRVCRARSLPTRLQMPLQSCPEPGCDYTTDRSNNLKRHMRKHTGPPSPEPSLPVYPAHWSFSRCRREAVRVRVGGLHLPHGRLRRAAAPQPPAHRRAPGQVRLARLHRGLPGLEQPATAQAHAHAAAQSVPLPEVRLLGSAAVDDAGPRAAAPL